MAIDLTFCGKTYTFETKAGLFSKDKIDKGSLLLLSNVNINNDDVILDIGCGYGAIGLVIAGQTSRGKVYMVDTDIRAVKYSKINAKLNSISNVEILLSDGFKNVSKELKFDVVLSNPPSHMPKETIIEFIEGSRKYLKKGGKLYFVTEKRIRPMIEREFLKEFHNYELIKSDSTYAISFASQS